MEVASFVSNVSQFEPNESTGECVAFAAAQIIRMVAPDQSNPSSPEDIDQLADRIYQSITGQMTEPIPVSVEQLKEILLTFGVHFQEIGIDAASIAPALASGCPVIVQGAESGFRYASDNSSPYAWDSSPYNHCIILSGIQSGTGYFVRDSANGMGYAPVYSKNSMNLFSAIQIIPAWIGGTMYTYGPNSSDFGAYFTATDAQHWTCTQTGAVVQFGNLSLYCTLSIGGLLPVIGLPLESEQPHTEADGYYWSSQQFERATMIYDPAHRLDSQPGMGTSYLMHINPPSTEVIEKIPDAVAADIKAVKAASDKLVTDAGMN